MKQKMDEWKPLNRKNKSPQSELTSLFVWCCVWILAGVVLILSLNYLESLGRLRWPNL